MIWIVILIQIWIAIQKMYLFTRNNVQFNEVHHIVVHCAFIVTNGNPPGVRFGEAFGPTEK